MEYKKNSSLEPLLLTIRALCFLFVMQESLHSWSLLRNQNSDFKTKLKHPQKLRIVAPKLRAIRSSGPPTGSFAPNRMLLARLKQIHFMPQNKWFHEKKPMFLCFHIPFFQILILSAAILCCIVPFFRNSDNICDMDKPACRHCDFFRKHGHNKCTT